MDDAELVPKQTGVFFPGEGVVVDGQLHDGRRVDDAPVALAEAAAAGGKGLLADGDSVVGLFAA